MANSITCDICHKIIQHDGGRNCFYLGDSLPVRDYYTISISPIQRLSLTLDICKECSQTYKLPQTRDDAIKFIMEARTSD